MKLSLRCNCGAHYATEAAYGQMNHSQRIEHLARVVACETCRYDRHAGLAREITASPAREAE